MQSKIRTKTTWTVWTEKGPQNFTTGRQARSFRRRVGAVWAQWGAQNQTIHHGGGEYYALTAQVVDFGKREVGVPFLTNNTDGWVSAAQRSVGGFVSCRSFKGWATPQFLKKWVQC